VVTAKATLPRRAVQAVGRQVGLAQGRPPGMQGNRSDLTCWLCGPTPGHAPSAWATPGRRPTCLEQVAIVSAGQKPADLYCRRSLATEVLRQCEQLQLVGTGRARRSLNE